MPPRTPYKVTYKRKFRRNKPRKLTRAQIHQVIDATKEPKYATGAIAPTGVLNTGTITPFGMPSQGDAFNQREGDVLQWRRIYGNVTCAGADATNIIRFIMIQSLTDDASDAPVISDIVQDTANCATSMLNMNLNIRGKYKILVDRIVTTSLNGNNVKWFKFNVNCKKLIRAKFNPGLQTGTGLLWFFMASDSAAITHPTIAFQIAYKWSDV